MGNFDPTRLRPLPREFFDRDPRKVARDLLGKVLVRRERGRLLAARVVETEAYLGTEDPAAHAFAGPTERNRVLFGPPGHAYVYFIYGNHHCLNVSCEPEGMAGCVLFRALEPLQGESAMAKARGLAAPEPAAVQARPGLLRHLTSGPGRLAEAFGITRPRDNGKDLTSAENDLFLADDGAGKMKIESSARVGITKAAERRLRFYVEGNAFVSGKRVESSK
jgi:DNA-3-methyladenine glycosylase